MDKPTKTKLSWRHFWQTPEWAFMKESTGLWKAKELTLDQEKSIFVYTRSVPVLGKVHYIPKLSELELDDIDTLTKLIKSQLKSGVCVSVELDQEFSELIHERMQKNGWHYTDSVQYDETVLVDLKPSIDEIFMSFKTRSRWEIRSAERRGAVVERVEVNSENMNIMAKLLDITSARGNFTIRSQDFLESYWQYFSEKGMGYMYFVRHEADILSASYIIRVGERAYYKDGASVRMKSDKFASRLMHWQIIKDMKNEGVKIYDMCGVMNSKHTDDRNKGLMTFKSGFAPVVRLQGAYTMPIGRYRHKLWSKFEPFYRKLYFKLKKDLWY